MRTITLFLRNADEADVAKLLSKVYPFQPGPPWVYPIDGKPCLYIDFDQENLERCNASSTHPKELLGYVPRTCLIATVSGTFSADKEVRKFVSTVLNQFEGCAQDDYSDHCWTIEEIESNRRANDRPFFDYSSG